MVKLLKCRRKQRDGLPKPRKANFTKGLWPGVSFSVSSICAPFEELEEYLMSIYYDMLPLCGVQRSAQKELRQIDRVFY